MSKRLGPVQLENPAQDTYGPRYSQETGAAVDEEVRRLTNEAHDTAKKIIEEHRDKHKLIAEALLKYETLDEKQILSLWNDGKMPESSDKSEFPSERAATFEEAKRELERKEAERQAELEKDHGSDSQSDSSTGDTSADDQSDESEKPDDVSNNDQPKDQNHDNDDNN